MTEYSKVHFTQAIAEDRAARARQGAAPKFGASGSNVVSITAAADQIGMDERPTPPLDAYGDWGGADFDEHNSKAEQSETAKSLSPRAADLASRLVPMDQIKPVLSSLYLVKGWLERGTSSVMFGPSNVGKTFLALDMAMHVAAGQSWHGNRVPPKETQSGPVVYVAGEGGFGIRNRLEAMRCEHPSLVAACEDGAFFLLPTKLDLCTSHDAAHLVDALASFDPPPALIVIDTLARAMGNGDENTAKDMGAFVASVDAIRDATGAHVMVIHHSGKDAARGARGSGSLKGATDTEIELTREGDVITAEALKQRDGPSGAIFAYQLRSVFLGNDEDGDAVTSAIVEPTDAPTKRAPRLKGQTLIAMQAFGDALSSHGEIKQGSDFPSNRQCVSLEQWREACDRHSLTDGCSDSAARTAFGRAWKALQEKQIIRVIDGFAWRCADE